MAARVDFYKLDQGTPETVLVALSARALAAGERVLVVSSEPEQLARIDELLWQGDPCAFLAHGLAGGESDADQPILLSSETEPTNGARLLAIADGVWRDDAERFARCLFPFDQSAIEAARDAWRSLRDREGMERHFWKQQDGKWVEGP